MGRDVRHLFPRDANDLAATEPRRQAPDQTRAVAERARPAENRDDLEPLTRSALEGELIDVSATPALRIEQLMVHEQQAEVDRLAQFWPTFVRIRSGTAATEMIAMTTR